MKNYKLSPVVLLLVFLISNLNQTLNAQNQAGMPDPNFGTNGQVITSFAPSYNVTKLNDIALQSDGKIVAAGIALDNSPPTIIRLQLVRYNADGSLDQSFGQNGATTFPSIFFTEASAVAVQPDGKILVAGTMHLEPYAFALARYNTDGSLDNSFGRNGLALVDFTGFEERSQGRVCKILLSPDNKITVVGTKQFSYFLDDFTIPPRQFFAMARYHPDGNLDESFGHFGKVLTEISPNSNVAEFAGLQSDGKILILGSSYWIKSTNPLTSSVTTTIVRYNADGRIDASFGANGILSFFSNSLNSFIIAPNRELLLYIHGKLQLYNEDGSFNRHILTGYIPLPNGESFGMRGFERQTDGKIVAVGAIINSNHNLVEVAFARYHPDGQLDASFGDNGLVRRASVLSLDTRKILVQPDGKLLAAGNVYYRFGGNSIEFTLFRHLGDAPNNNRKALKR
jgi:uncharacterized delta-60 repeat protein